VFGLPDPARLPLVGRLFGDAADQPWRDVLSAPARAAPRTSFNRKVSAHRRWVFATLSLDDVKAVKNAAGVTVNDVVMAICAGALRRWLIDHEELPAEPLLAMVPVSVRTEAERGSFGNQVSAMIATLPTDEADAGARLARTNDAMRIAKEQHRPSRPNSSRTSASSPPRPSRRVRHASPPSSDSPIACSCPSTWSSRTCRGHRSRSTSPAHDCSPPTRCRRSPTV